MNETKKKINEFYYIREWSFLFINKKSELALIVRSKFGMRNSTRVIWWNLEVRMYSNWKFSTKEANSKQMLSDFKSSLCFADN